MQTFSLQYWQSSGTKQGLDSSEHANASQTEVDTHSLCEKTSDKVSAEGRTGYALEDAHDADGGQVKGGEVARHAALQEHAENEQRRRPAQHLSQQIQRTSQCCAHLRTCAQGVGCAQDM